MTSTLSQDSATGLLRTLGSLTWSASVAGMLASASALSTTGKLVTHAEEPLELTEHDLWEDDTGIDIGNVHLQNPEH